METRSISCPICSTFLGSLTLQEGEDETKWAIAAAPYVCSTCYTPPEIDESTAKLESLTTLLQENPAVVDLLLDTLKKSGG